jgi:hypothetical protein
MAKRGGKRRDPAREQFWRRTIRRQQRSGLSVPEFCRREGLKGGAFRWWRLELARRDQQAASAPRGEPERQVTEAVPVFLPVRVVDPDAIAPRHAPPIEVVLPNGLIIRVPAGFDPSSLGHVLAVLEARPC